MATLDSIPHHAGVSVATPATYTFQCIITECDRNGHDVYLPITFPLFPTPLIHPKMAEHYIDADAFDAYAEHDGQELALSQLINASVQDVFDAWLQLEWLARGSTLKPGEGRGLVGHRRLVSLGVEEQIESAGVPDSSDKIPSVSYSIKKSGPLLLSDHMALVQFVADTTAPPSAPKTLVLWNSKLTPSTAGSVLLCGGSISRLVLRTVLSSSLDSLAASFQNETRSM